MSDQSSDVIALFIGGPRHGRLGRIRTKPVYVKVQCDQPAADRIIEYPAGLEVTVDGAKSIRYLAGTVERGDRPGESMTVAVLQGSELPKWDDVRAVCVAGLLSDSHRPHRQIGLEALRVIAVASVLPEHAEHWLRYADALDEESRQQETGPSGRAEFIRFVCG